MTAVLKFKPQSPMADEIEIRLPSTVNKSLFKSGFDHGMRSNTLTNFKASYRAGFRAAKLYIRELNATQGIHSMPRRSKFVATSK